MVARDSDIYAESYYPVKIGQGIYTSELPSNIPDGFSAKAFNLVATGDSLENRIGIRQSSVNWSALYGGLPDLNNSQFAVHAPGITDSCAFLWSTWDGAVSHLHLVRSRPAAMGGDGYMMVTMPTYIKGITSYSNNIYFNMHDSNSIYRITSFNWVTDAITYISIPSAAATFTNPSASSLVSFKDRLWCLVSDRLYFTEIAGLGQLPETWAATNYIKITGARGLSTIKKVVPLLNKLLIFTESGVFSLLVEGEPSSWILKNLDSESISTTRSCAFESRSIVYYVNTAGVWATNGQSVAKISGVIEDQFFLAKGVRYHSIHPYEDGILLAIAKTVGNTNFYDSLNCRIFYSKSDPVGWTEWNIDNSDGSVNNFGANRLTDIQSVSPKLPTFLNPEPTTYLLASVTDSTEAVTQWGRHQFLIFDGGENQLVNRAGTVITDKMNCVLKTKYMDGGNPYRNKSLKQGYIELYTSDSQHQFQSSWDIDSTIGASTTVRDTTVVGFTVGQATNLIRLAADFKFRRCALTISTKLQTNTSQIKIKDVALVMAVDRDEPEIIR